jgi:hypothetical protein
MENSHFFMTPRENDVPVIRRSYGFIIGKRQASQNIERRQIESEQEVRKVTDYIDQERMRILQLEKEANLIRNECALLQHQIEQIDSKLASAREIQCSNKAVQAKIKRISKAISLICLNWALGPEPCDLYIDRILDSIKDIDPKIAELVRSTGFARCTAIVDAPSSGHSLQDFILTYEKGLSELLGQPIDSIPITHVTEEKSGSRALRLTCTVPGFAKEILAPRIEASGSLTPASKFVIDVTRSFILDAPPVIDISQKSRESAVVEQGSYLTGARANAFDLIPTGTRSPGELPLSSAPKAPASARDRSSLEGKETPLIGIRQMVPEIPVEAVRLLQPVGEAVPILSSLLRFQASSQDPSPISDKPVDPIPPPSAPKAPASARDRSSLEGKETPLIGIRQMVPEIGIRQIKPEIPVEAVRLSQPVGEAVPILSSLLQYQASSQDPSPISDIPVDPIRVEQPTTSARKDTSRTDSGGSSPPEEPMAQVPISRWGRMASRTSSSYNSSSNNSSSNNSSSNYSSSLDSRTSSSAKASSLISSSSNSVN